MLTGTIHWIFQYEHYKDWPATWTDITALCRQCGQILVCQLWEALLGSMLQYIYGCIPVPSLIRWPDVLESFEQLQRKLGLSCQCKCFTHSQLVTVVYVGIILSHVNLYPPIYCRFTEYLFVGFTSLWYAVNDWKPPSLICILSYSPDFSIYLLRLSFTLWLDVCISFSAKLRQNSKLRTKLYISWI